MTIYRNCVCVELSNIKSPLKCRRALCRHPHVNIAGGVLSVVTAVMGPWPATDSNAPTLLGPLRHASFCFKDAASCVCDAVFLSCGRGLTPLTSGWGISPQPNS